MQDGFPAGVRQPAQPDAHARKRRAARGGRRSEAGVADDPDHVQAWAEPSGCTHNYPDFRLSGYNGRYLMIADSNGSCSTYATRRARRGRSSRAGFKERHRRGGLFV